MKFLNKKVHKTRDSFMYFATYLNLDTCSRQVK